MTAPAIPPVPGERFRLRNGTRVGPIERNASDSLGAYPFRWGGYTWTGDGRHHAGQAPSDLDIVGPVRVPARDKLICDVTLADLRRGTAVVMGGTYAR